MPDGQEPVVVVIEDEPQIRRFLRPTLASEGYHVVEAATVHGVAIDWRLHARTGVPVTLLTLAIAASWLAIYATVH